MEFETIERCGRTYVIKNGVESVEFVVPSFDGQTVYQPEILGEYKTLSAAVKMIALHMDDWYTSAEAAVRLVELGAYNKLPDRQAVTRIAKDGLIPGAVMIHGKGAAGRGGQWRLSEAWCQELANRRMKR